MVNPPYLSNVFGPIHIVFTLLTGAIPKWHGRPPFSLYDLAFSSSASRAVSLDHSCCVWQ
jgi:hypothetical protein